MADTTNTQELLVTTFAAADALTKLLIEKGLITHEEFTKKLSAKRVTYHNFSILHGNENARWAVDCHAWFTFPQRAGPFTSRILSSR